MSAISRRRFLRNASLGAAVIGTAYGYNRFLVYSAWRSALALPMMYP